MHNRLQIFSNLFELCEVCYTVPCYIFHDHVIATLLLSVRVNFKRRSSLIRL